MKKTIYEIMTEGQKKRHDNHVRAGKNIKEKWKQECMEEFKKIVERKRDYYISNYLSHRDDIIKIELTNTSIGMKEFLMC